MYMTIGRQKEREVRTTDDRIPSKIHETAVVNKMESAFS